MQDVDVQGEAENDVAMPELMESDDEEQYDSEEDGTDEAEPEVEGKRLGRGHRKHYFPVEYWKTDAKKVEKPKLAYTTKAIQEPLTYLEAVGGPEKELWKEAVDEEISALEQNGTSEPREHQRTKHLDIKSPKIREWITASKIRLEYVPSNRNIADHSLHKAYRLETSLKY